MGKLRGQCYDEASNMLGKTFRVVMELQKFQPKANYTHCHAHSLSLSIKDVTKKVKILGDTMVTAREIIVLIKYSPKEKTSGEKSKNKLNVMKKWKSNQIRYRNYPKQDGLFAQNVSKEFWIIIKN